MPSTTFLNLPPEKRKKFLQCARAEFARVPYADASINQIIRAAGIPRGSFYMYFADKGELFQYLVGTYAVELEALFERALRQTQGDLFAAFRMFYDLIQTKYRAPGRDEVFEDLMNMFRLNHQMQPQLFLQGNGPPPALSRLRSLVDEERLDLRGSQDFEHMFQILAGVTGAAILKGTLAEDPDPVRARLVNMLSILERGMARVPAEPAAPSSTERIGYK